MYIYIYIYRDIYIYIYTYNFLIARYLCSPLAPGDLSLSLSLSPLSPSLYIASIVAVVAAVVVAAAVVVHENRQRFAEGSSACRPPAVTRSQPWSDS